MSFHPAASGLAVPGTWWQRRSLKLRLAVWFALLAFGLLLALVPVIYNLTERRLNADLDRRMEIDWVLIEAHLESDGAGGVRWRRESPSTLESGGYAESWFDVWADGRKRMAHWPGHGFEIGIAPAGSPQASSYHDLRFPDQPAARVLQRSAEIGGRTMILRLFHDKRSIEETLREILISLGLGVPLAVTLAAVGGYFMAGRTMRPIVEMTEQARRITSESLSRRLPNPNPHNEIGELAGVFNETLARLEASFDALRRFTADASHELRTPLTALRSVGEIALRGSDDAESLRETIGSMLEEAQRLHDLADTLLLLARVESGRTAVELSTVALGPMIEGIADRLEVLAAEKRQKLLVDAAPGVSAMADRVLVEQATANLLHNAIRYSPPDTTIRIAVSGREDSAVIEVSDEGPGIASEHHERIFERFYRIDKARSRADGGTGLGLALARLFVGQCGGDITLSSEPGRGSTFRIRLPMPD